MLQGFWDPRGRSPTLGELLDPDNLVKHALPTNHNPAHRRFNEQIIDNYRTDLATLSGDTSEVIRAIAEVRNLVHGVGSYPSSRQRRLNALRALDEFNTQYVRDIAVIWWTAVLTSSSTHALPGQSPIGGSGVDG